VSEMSEVSAMSERQTMSAKLKTYNYERK